MEDSFSLNQGAGDDSGALCLLCPLLRLHQLHLRSSGIRSRRSRTPVLSDARVPTSSPGYFLPPSSACVLRRQPVTGPAAVSPLGDRRCNPWGLRGTLKGVVSQGLHRLDSEAARAPVPARPWPETFPAPVRDYSKHSGGPYRAPRPPPTRPGFTSRCEVVGKRQKVCACGLTGLWAPAAQAGVCGGGGAEPPGRPAL